MSNAIILKPGKDKPIRKRHHWIFSGAVKKFPSFQDGDFLPVYSFEGKLLGSGYFQKRTQIVGRMVSFDDTPPLQAIEANIHRASALRKMLFQTSSTNGYRLINAEGDLIPGLIVDRYAEVLVIQISTLGIDKLRDWIVQKLHQIFSPAFIIEKSSSSSRKQEGLEPVSQILHGTEIEQVEIIENQLSFYVPLLEGQKTGFFLDHREMRQTVKQFSSGRRVLNLFSYTGSFGIYALAGGALSVDSVDISKMALSIAKQHVIKNKLSLDKCTFYQADAFDFLENNSLNYDLAIIDPPAFAKKSGDIPAACNAYRRLNQLVFEKLPKGAIVLTFSCSYHIDSALFQTLIFQAAYNAKRMIKIIGRHIQAKDHPINLFHPESDYLKGLVLYLE